VSFINKLVKSTPVKVLKWTFCAYNFFSSERKHKLVILLIKEKRGCRVIRGKPAKNRYRVQTHPHGTRLSRGHTATLATHRSYTETTKGSSGEILNLRASSSRCLPYFGRLLKDLVLIHTSWWADRTIAVGR
jgi:hypothetical protein